MTTDERVALESVLRSIDDLPRAITRDCSGIVQRLRRNWSALKRVEHCREAIAAGTGFANTTPERDFVEHVSGRFEGTEDYDWESA